MLGKYQLEVYNKRIHYSLEIKRNITLIQGNSGTGKTTLIRMISDYERLGTGSGITIKCETYCRTLTSSDWSFLIMNSNGIIFFVDETASFLSSKEFADAVNESDNYFVIIYRDSLPMLSYSIEEIYEFRPSRYSQKYPQTRRVYNELHKLYNLNISEHIKPYI